MTTFWGWILDHLDHCNIAPLALPAAYLSARNQGIYFRFPVATLYPTRDVN